MELFRMAAPCVFGLESLVADELKRLNMQDVLAENGRVLFSAGQTDIARANISLRCAERVLLMLGSFPAPTFDALFEGTRALPWERFLPADAAFPVKGHALSSMLHAVPACQSIVKKAIVTRLQQAYGTAALPETGTFYQVQFSIMKDTATLYLDTSGAGLHKRGYRPVGVAAPLRETLAAALVTLSHYRGRDPFCDPFCGSGTIPIEAALIAKNRAPGLGRNFSAQKWECLPSKCWMDAAEEAIDLEYDGSYDIWGGDNDPAAVELSRENARRADVSDLISFDFADAAFFTRSTPYGRVVTNPPYGERIMEHAEAEVLYRSFGQAAGRLPPGWKLFILSSHTEFERTFGRQAAKRRKLYNGMLKCNLFMY